LGLHAHVRHSLAHVLDRWHLPRLRHQVADNTVMNGTSRVLRALVVGFLVFIAGVAIADGTPLFKYVNGEASLSSAEKKQIALLRSSRLNRSASFITLTSGSRVG
jgi:hypothetical protein